MYKPCNKQHWWAMCNFSRLLSNCQGIFNIHLPLLGHSLNFSPPNYLNTCVDKFVNVLFHYCFILPVFTPIQYIHTYLYILCDNYFLLHLLCYNNKLYLVISHPTIL